MDEKKKKLIALLVKQTMEELRRLLLKRLEELERRIGALESKVKTL